MTYSDKVNYLENYFKLSFENIAKTIIYCEKNDLNIKNIKSIKTTKKC